ncbi:multidrug effflux MFS transporter [Sphingomonas jaspsi]|uniref:multidrug effflux MFS transporter n=1 Tax=Sphingomonas jaspsi TaxID=392409 RepID=UPI00055D7E30|nr:multidrug effflux MFS transporter [Sphingomonas jaspsi]
MHAPNAPATRLGPREIIVLLAGLMALNSFAIDAMLPALPDIGRDLGISEENRRQLVIVAYMFGFGSTQLIWGPLADRFGRKPILLSGMALYVAFALLCGMATSFELLVAARFAMGASSAVTRVLVTAMVRDLFEGEEMARIMSLTFMVFMLMPMIAPTLGQGILLIGTWRLIFAFLAGWAFVAGLWAMWRLPETLHPEYRRSLDIREIGKAVRRALTDRLSLGYTLAMTATFGALVAYIATIQQIIGETFGRPDAIGWTFAAIAVPMAIGSFTNASIVRRFGVRAVSHWGTVAFLSLALIHAGVATFIGESLIAFVVMQALTNGMLAFTSANFSTLAMSRMADVAGTASSVQGVMGTVLGALLGLVIGQAYDGSERPFLWGMAASAALALFILLVVERGRLFARPDRAASA